MSEYIIRLPTPHAKQADFLDSPAKRKVIVAGRRGGKTTGVAMLAVERALDGRRVLEAAPTADQTGAFWTAVKKYLAEPIAAGVVYKNETDRLIEMPNKGRIRCKTAFDADTLRGDYADLLILDEYSLMKPSAWDEVGAPMLLDNDGDAVFIFTPQRKNHAHAMYARALGDQTGRWAAWHFTSFDNPYLSKEALDEITADMTDDAYRQEILAEFLDNEGQVFRNLAACMHAVSGDHRGHRIVAGVDWAKQSDYTAISIGCADCRTEIAIDRFNQIDYGFQQERLKSLIAQYRVLGVLPERNSIGDPVIDQLLREGVPVLSGPDERPGFLTTATSKPPLIENLALVFEREEWQFIANPIWTAELEAYERKVSPITGRPQYSAPEGVHDDTVIARALMVWAAGRAARLPDRQPEQRSKWTDYNVEDGSRWRKF